MITLVTTHLNIMTLSYLQYAAYSNSKYNLCDALIYFIMSYCITATLDVKFDETKLVLQLIIDAVEVHEMQTNSVQCL